MGDIEFKCPHDCLPGVGEVWSGQYDFPAKIHGPIRVLDIGANVGAFALWARRRWPECSVTSFEPHPITYGYLRRNCCHDKRIITINCAVGDPELSELRPGNDTRLCCGFYDLGRQSIPSIHVQVVGPEQVSAADIVKIDCEGSEAFIVERLKFVPELLVVEYHSEALRQRLEAALRGKMQLIEAHVATPGLGHLKFFKKEVSCGI